MKRKLLRYGVWVLFWGGLWVWWVHRPQPAASEPTAIELQKPTNTFLVNEAGIMAYAYLSRTIRLDYVAPAFRTIEAQTADYVLGSVALPEYAITDDPHVYIHRAGWVAAYYEPDAPVSKIFDWHTGTLTNTLLEQALSSVLIRDGLALPPVAFYDFRYPQATHMLWMQKDSGTFYLNLPSQYVIYERSWALGGENYGYGSLVDLLLDGVSIGKVVYNLYDGSCYRQTDGSDSWCHARGTLTAAQLLPDLVHTFEVQPKSGLKNFGAFVLVYRDAP